MVKKPEQYLYSGHRAYLEGKATEAIDPRKVLRILGGKARYRAFVRDGIEDGHKEEFYEVADQRFLGADGFGEKLQDQHDGPTAKKRGALEKVVKDFGNELAVGVVELKSADRSWAVSKARTMIAYVLVRRQGYGLGEVAQYFARDAATVGTLIARLGERMEQDEKLRREIARLTRSREIKV